MTIRTRFAPSPTGSLHVGGVRTALYCWLYAKQTGGKFILRIEDTDQARSTEEAARGIQRDLQWCGLSWDEGPEIEGDCGPYFQSRRLDLYNHYIDQLLTSEHAYLAWETKEELDEFRRQAEASKTTFRYRFRPYTSEDIARFQAEARIPVVRLKSPTHAVQLHDDILGEVQVSEHELEDIVIRKADGFPTYHFAVVIDDHHMRISHILRGQEHLLNTPKHVGIYEALQWDMPNHGHLPLIFNPIGAKMSKRDKAKEAREAARKAQEERKKAGQDPMDWSWLATAAGQPLESILSFQRKEHDRIPIAEAIATALGISLPMIEVMDFRKGGYLPEALINYMALLGWSPGDDREVMSLEEMIHAFDVSRINHTSARFDPVKLKWMNGEYIKKASISRLIEATRSFLEVAPAPMARCTDDQLSALFQLYRDRVLTLAELETASRFLFVRPQSFDEKAAKKILTSGALGRLQACHDALIDVFWNAEAIEQILSPLSEGNMGSIAQPLRLAITGTGVSPPIFETIAFLERKEVGERIQNCIERFSG